MNDYTGYKNGRLNVIRKSDYKDGKSKLVYWVCTCDCTPDKEFLVRSSYISQGKDSCGCLTKEKRKNNKKKYNTYNLEGEYGVGYTNKGKEFYFDLEDYDKIKEYCWNCHDGYIEARAIDGGKNIKLHRLIMGIHNKDGKLKVDHINHDKSDNRKENLRICTNQENCMNHKIHRNNTSGKSGISYRKDTGKWRVRIWHNYKCYSLGSYSSYEEAVEVRNKKEKELFKEFRNENENT